MVADNFRTGTDKNIVVALPNDVFMVNKRNLAKPTRQSLSTPTKLLKSKSDVVNAPVRPLPTFARLSILCPSLTSRPSSSLITHSTDR